MALPDEVDFVVKVESGRNLVDMNYTLDTLKGFSTAIGAVADSTLTNNVKARSNPADDIRTELLEAVLGSYVQTFRLKISDPVKAHKFKKMGSSVLSELITYYVNEVLHAEQPILTKKASEYIRKLEPVENKIIQRIHSWVSDMHTISVRKNYSVKLFRKTEQRTFKMLEVSKQTYGNAFELTEDENSIDIEVVISRFNIFTGNGRLLREDENSTVPFSFATSYSKIKASYKQSISGNLLANTAVPDEDRVNITLRVKPKRNRSGEVVKYVIYEVEPE
ncbi:hypothetical protein CBW22_16795 [Pantoea sp. VS1]|uniref:hypothetical protein n=1 Tax=Pantoea sp. VS1 TaxID=2003658 RepID=UPI000B50766E|nr:hypothetical protein [Pantoea sp. VS1]OWS74046.1 hypothetical protein CBW22_16795 [Pantoea sp. VS1]